ncbi:MAG: SO2930 family diheme c-type cytochrome [Gammaproteobacteria bacterium]
MRSFIVSAVLGCLLAACSDSPTPVFHESENPGRLSDWGLFTLTDSEFVPAPESLVFRPANILFSDYAQKLRTLWIPEGSKASLVDGEIEYPVGTVLSKTFYYPSDENGNPVKTDEVVAESVSLSDNRLMETRLLVRRQNGWAAFPYVWNEEETEAFLRVAGSSQALDLQTPDGSLQFSYFVPNENQCAGCHVTEHPDGDMHPLGAISHQLSYKRYQPDDGDLEMEIDKLVARGWLDATPMRLETFSYLNDGDLQTRALEYLKINCGHCHNPDGAADTSNLILNGEHGQLVNMGVCKPPVAAGGGAGDRLYSIVPGEPDQSILLYRMQSQEPDEMMPELGRSLVHEEGVDLIGDWIRQISGSCNSN